MSSSSFAPTEQGSEESTLNNRDGIIMREFDQTLDNWNIPKQSYDQIYQMKKWFKYISLTGLKNFI